ncbi:hypothetical protein DPMN_051104 [Dreissena polymorpha]|uniref:Uncharacterized protein n=1 Tax=Dreissena polymorpha TaxID=45954 RepID=A0A9D4CJ55_DREPO|nr:hypothetical protein DPMN_051104 [Dreissena polymorpha]
MEPKTSRSLGGQHFHYATATYKWVMDFGRPSTIKNPKRPRIILDLFSGGF